jgi:hypothetical protein
MQTVLVVLGGLMVGYLIGRLFATPRSERFVQVQPPPVDGVPPAGQSARAAAASIREFGALVERLTARDVAVDDVLCEPGTGWRLGVERGADADQYGIAWELGKSRKQRWATRVSWNAGDQNVRVERSIHEPGLAPNQWKDEPGIPIGSDGDAMGAAEAFILERFATGAAPHR